MQGRLSFSVTWSLIVILNGKHNPVLKWSPNGFWVVWTGSIVCVCQNSVIMEGKDLSQGRNGEKSREVGLLCFIEKRLFMANLRNWVLICCVVGKPMEFLSWWKCSSGKVTWEGGESARGPPVSKVFGDSTGIGKDALRCEARGRSWQSVLMHINFSTQERLMQETHKF